MIHLRGILSLGYKPENKLTVSLYHLDGKLLHNFPTEILSPGRYYFEGTFDDERMLMEVTEATDTHCIFMLWLERSKRAWMRKRVDVNQVRDIGPFVVRTDATTGLLIRP